MKVRTSIQFREADVCVNDFEKRIKQIWKDGGNLAKDLNTIDIYFKVEENKCYYVINGNVTGDFAV